MKWHLRLGHPGPEALEHLVNHSRGARIKGKTSIKGVPTYKCDGCGLAKARRRIRRQQREFTEGLGERLALDFHDYEIDSDGYKTLLLIMDRWSGHAFDFYLLDHTTTSIKEALNFLLGYLKRQCNIDVKTIECDNEIINNKPELVQFFRNRSIKIESSAPYTQDQKIGRAHV